MSIGELEKLIKIHQEPAQFVCEKLISEMISLGFQASELDNKPDYATAIFELVKDPYTGDNNLQANWLDKHNQRIGQLQFLSNGSVYAEYDVIKQHPGKADMFVEAVTAWGKTGYLKSEARIIPYC